MFSCCYLFKNVFLTAFLTSFLSSSSTHCCSGTDAGRKLQPLMHMLCSAGASSGQKLQEDVGVDVHTIHPSLRHHMQENHITQTEVFPKFEKKKLKGYK